MTYAVIYLSIYLLQPVLITATLAQMQLAVSPVHPDTLWLLMVRVKVGIYIYTTANAFPLKISPK